MGEAPGGQDRPKRSVEGRRPTPEDLRRLGASAGLCATCRHARILASRTSVFLRCTMAEVDPAFQKYPALPVTACRGYERTTD